MKLIRLRLPFGLPLLLAWLISPGPLPAATLSNPQVDRYNVHVGTQTFAGLYQFTTNTLLVETAQAISGLGSDVIKGYLGPDFKRQYNITLPGNVTNLLTLARDEPSCHRVLDMPFRHFILWAYPLVGTWPFDGYSSSERATEYREMYDLTRYLLTNYNNSGKTFYLGHWEGDWYLLPNYNTATNPTPTAIQGMVDWLNNRQQAVDDAKRDTAHANVDVFNYIEVNRVRDAMSGDTNINQRAINMVVPYVTNLDCLSWSSYDGMNLDGPTLTATLNYIQSKMPANKAATFPGRRVWIGEYGWGGYTPAVQEPLNRAYIQRLLNWGPRFILFWEIYDNETNSDGSYRSFCLIDQNNNKVPSYYLHQRFINNARLAVARFQETNGRLPSDAEFAALTAPALNSPLPPPANLAVRHSGATPPTNGVVQVCGTLTQGVYGDDLATVWVFWGRQDGGTTRSAWEQSQNLGLNTNFNPATFTCVLSNLAPSTNYYFRFYATNASGEAWAPASSQLLDPLAYGTRMKIRFAGYNRGEPLASFPVLVNLGSNLPGFSYRQFASPKGGDLRFADATGGQALFHEIDEWNTSGVSSVWVQVPCLASTNDYVWAYWGNPLATNPPAWTTNGAVWSGYDLVWHLKESGFPYADSTQQHPALTGAQPGSTAGVVGHGCFFNGSSQYLDAGSVNLGQSFTLSAWVKIDTSATSSQSVWANKSGGWNSDGFALFVNSWGLVDQKLILETGDGVNGTTAATGPNVVTPGQWHCLTAVVDEASGAADLYVDGVEQTQAGAIQTDFHNQSLVNLARFTNGGAYFKGIMDEVRIENGLRSANWVWASWLTMASNAVFSSYAAPLQQAPALSTAMSGGLLLSWPASGVGFALYTATNLVPPVAWSLVSSSPVLVGTQWQVALSPDFSATRFYRLQAQ